MYTNNKNKQVEVIYRNYSPLYTGYSSFWLSSIPGYHITIPETRTWIKKFYLVYKKIKSFPFAHFFIQVAQNILFPTACSRKDADLIFYAGIMPSAIPSQPFVVDFEHIYALLNYTFFTELQKQKLLQNLSHERCKALLPWSEAAKKTLEQFYTREEYSQISHKVKVLYPAIPSYTSSGLKPHYTYVKKTKQLKLLFIGKDPGRKGLFEVLEAFTEINKKFKDKVALYVVSNLTQEDKDKYKQSNLYFYPASFSHNKLVTHFFLPSDIFIMPTHADTFGMVFLEALSCGLPVITTCQFATPEFIRDGQNGFFVASDNLFLNSIVIPSKKETGDYYDHIEEKLVKDIINKIEHILKNSSMISFMKNEAIKDFAPYGKFSLETRNSVLKDIFDKAVY